VIQLDLFYLIVADFPVLEIISWMQDDGLGDF